MLVVVAMAVWYAVGVARLWQHAGVARGLGWRQVQWFAGACVILAATLTPAADRLTDAHFAAHMVQHLVLILVVAPLLVLGLPSIALVWALPKSWRPTMGRILVPSIAPWLALVLHTTALAVWHLPAMYALALDHPLVHAMEHASFLVTACLFWWVVLQPVGHRRLGYGAAVLYVGTFMTLMGVASAVLTFAREPWYGSSLEEQQLAGVIMWVPATTVYLIALGVCYVEWLRVEGVPA
jgi:putative membrane protein